MRDIGRMPGTGSRLGHRLVHPPLDGPGQALGDLGRERRQQDAHDGRAEDEVVDLDVDQLEHERVARDDEAELADLGHRAAEEEGGAQRHPEPAPEDGDDEALAGDRDQHEQRDESAPTPSSASGSTSIPTDTKNRTANRSRNGMTSAAAW